MKGRSGLAQKKECPTTTESVGPSRRQAEISKIKDKKRLQTLWLKEENHEKDGLKRLKEKREMP